MPTDGRPNMGNTCNQDHLIHEHTNFAFDSMIPCGCSGDKQTNSLGDNDPASGSTSVAYRLDTSGNDDTTEYASN